MLNRGKSALYIYLPSYVRQGWPRPETRPPPKIRPSIIGTTAGTSFAVGNRGTNCIMGGNHYHDVDCWARYDYTKTI